MTRALALLDDAPGAVVVALHPDDHATLTATGAFPGVTLVPDATLSPGDATAACDQTTVDARIGAGLARVREVLGR